MNNAEIDEQQNPVQRTGSANLAESVYRMPSRQKPADDRRREPKVEDITARGAKPEVVEPANLAKPPAKDTYFAAKPDAHELKKLQPEINAAGAATVDIHLGLKFEKTADGEKLLKSLNAEVADQASQIKRHINTTGRDPGDVLGAAVSDPGKVTFFGEEHTPNSASRALLRSVVEKAPATAILTPEFPSSLRPLFDRYNASPKDSKFTIPADLNQLVGAKAAAFCRMNEETIWTESASLFEAAHRRGIRIIPVDDPAIINIVDLVPPDILKKLSEKGKVDENDPRVQLVAHRLESASLAFTRGHAKNPARERTIADNILAVTNEYPDSPILAHTGRTHAAEHTPTEAPVSKLLASNPEFIKKGKQVASFGVFDYEGQMFNSSLTSFARELDRPVCFPSAGDNNKKNPIASLPELREAALDNYGAYDQVILMCPKVSEIKTAENKVLPKLELTEFYLNEGSTADQRNAIQGFLTLGDQRFAEMKKLYEQNGITRDDINTLQTTLNNEGKDPVKMIHGVATPQTLLLIDDRTMPPDINPDRVPSDLLAEAIRGLPPGSKLAVDIPAFLAPQIDRYNKSQPDTPFETLFATPEYKKLAKDDIYTVEMLGTTVFSSEKLQVFEEAHRCGFEIVPIGTNVNILGTRDRFSEIATASNVYAGALMDLSQKNPNVPIVVWSSRLNQAHEIDRLLTSNDQFRASGRKIKTIGFVGGACGDIVGGLAGINVRDTLGPFATHLQKPIGLDLDTQALKNLASRSLASEPFSPDTSYRKCIQVLSETLGQRYDQLIMVPKK